MMNRQLRHNGFSLTEVLIATGIMALGLAMIAMAFPVGVKLASIATERPVGVVAGNEAFAKMRLYGISFTSPNWPPLVAPVTFDTTCTDYWQVCASPPPVVDDERCYPSLVPQPQERRYYWSALVRRADAGTGEIQATVFVCRMLGMGSKYYDMGHTLIPAQLNNDNQWPVPVRVSVFYPAFGNTITVNANTLFDIPGQTLTACRFFTEGCMIVEDKTGYLYRVIERRDVLPVDGIRETLVLDNMFPNKGYSKDILGNNLPLSGNVNIWVVPPAVGSSRNPCIDVVQTVMTIR